MAAAWKTACAIRWKCSDAVRAVWPDEKPISVRISANDWVGDRGVTPAEAVEIARIFQEAGVDICDVSAGQTTRQAKPVYGRMFQTPFSDRIRNETRHGDHGGRQHLRARPRQLDPDGGARRSRLPRRGRTSPIRTGRCTRRRSSATSGRPGRRPTGPAATSSGGSPSGEDAQTMKI